MSAPALAIDSQELKRFLERVNSGVGELNAAIEVGWTPAELRKYQKDAEFRELVQVCMDQRLERVESKAFELAERGQMRAIELVLFCKGAHRGWHPPTQKVSVERTETVKVEMVHSIKAAALQVLQTEGAIAALQSGAIEASVVDDS
jgi:hypothetical protein